MSESVTSNFIYPKNTKYNLYIYPFTNMITQYYNYHKSPIYLPSVSKLLETTKTPEQRQILTEWKNKVGEEEANRITQLSTSNGREMHRIVEHYIKYDKLDAPTNDNKDSHEMARTIIEQGLGKISQYFGAECHVYYPELYAGKTDCVAQWQGKLAIIDFKNTLKPKKREWVEDLLLQAVGYAMAHNAVFNTDIKTVVIMMAMVGKVYQEFSITDPEEFDKYANLWSDKVSQYYNVQS